MGRQPFQNDELVKRREKFHTPFGSRVVGLGIKLIELFKISTGLIDVYNLTTERGSIYVIDANPETLKWIAEESSRIEGLSPMFMPTIVPPRPWTGRGFH